MKIKMLTGLTGPQYSLAPGDERDFPDAEAKRLIEAGYAAPVGGVKTERAVKPVAPEKRG